MDIIIATEYRKQFLEAVNRLLPQLSIDARHLTADDLRRIIESKESVLFFAVDKEQISGTLTLILFATPTGSRARVEDFVVDTQARGRGIGKGLLNHAIRHARDSGAKTVALTSHPSRTAAHRLYKRSGFKVRETMVYHYDLFQTKNGIFP